MSNIDQLIQELEGLIYNVDENKWVSGSNEAIENISLADIVEAHEEKKYNRYVDEADLGEDFQTRKAILDTVLKTMSSLLLGLGETEVSYDNLAKITTSEEYKELLKKYNHRIW